MQNLVTDIVKTHLVPNDLPTIARLSQTSKTYQSIAREKKDARTLEVLTQKFKVDISKYSSDQISMLCNLHDSTSFALYFDNTVFILNRECNLCTLELPENDAAEWFDVKRFGDADDHQKLKKFTSNPPLCARWPHKHKIVDMHCSSKNMCFFLNSRGCLFYYTAGTDTSCNQDLKKSCKKICLAIEHKGVKFCSYPRNNILLCRNGEYFDIYDLLSNAQEPTPTKGYFNAFTYKAQRYYSNFLNDTDVKIFAHKFSGVEMLTTKEDIINLEIVAECNNMWCDIYFLTKTGAVLFAERSTNTMHVLQNESFHILCVKANSFTFCFIYKNAGPILVFMGSHLCMTI